MVCSLVLPGMLDHCRIGSLEIYIININFRLQDHCRIGSLERDQSTTPGANIDHCRIGSLESTLYA